MLINGCLVNDSTGIDENTLTEILAELGYEDEIENEELAVVGGDYEVYQIDGDEADFYIVSKDREYRCIHTKAIERVFEDEAAELYDEDQWREAVSSGGILEGYDDWFESIINDAEYGNFFASYDGREQECVDYYIFRVN